MPQTRSKSGERTWLSWSHESLAVLCTLGSVARLWTPSTSSLKSKPLAMSFKSSSSRSIRKVVVSLLKPPVFRPPVVLRCGLLAGTWSLSIRLLKGSLWSSLWSMMGLGESRLSRSSNVPPPVLHLTFDSPGDWASPSMALLDDRRPGRPCASACSSASASGSSLRPWASGRIAKPWGSSAASFSSVAREPRPSAPPPCGR
mmetsp:Transcript_117745/g.366843  ORF Transcript_117745/g.366843 Transcript_117745/m.366843 type:complete len:201 (-) Transcript_117745:553-1155(-)